MSSEQALPKRGRPTEAERAQRRERLLDEALPVFLRNGYERTTLEQLAKAAGVTKRTIYTDYGDKAGLFAAMVQRLAGGISAEYGKVQDSLLTLAARIVYRVSSDELVGLHRLVIAETERLPELPRIFEQIADSRHIAALRAHLEAEHGAEAADLAEPLFSLLLGEPHRRRLLGLTAAPDPEAATAHATGALRRLGLAA